MSKNFIEPDVQQTAPIPFVIKNLNVSPKDKEWLLSLFLEDIELHSDFIDILTNFFNENEEKDSSTKKVSFLFDSCVIDNSEYFIESKLLSERIKIIPSLFTEKAEDRPSVFKPYIANILYKIKDCAEKDKNFSDAYQEKLQEIRASSSIAERTCFYMKQKNLPKRTYETGEKPATEQEILEFLQAEEKYSWHLINELEEIIIYYNEDIFAFPFLVYGKKVFECVRNTLKRMLNKFDPCDLLEKIEIPKWDEKNYIHEIFFHLAMTFDNKDFSMLILDKIFDGVKAVDIPYIFFCYIEDSIGSIYRVLLKGGYNNTIEMFSKGEYPDVIKTIRAELEYLDWALTAAINTNDLHKIYFEKSRLFLDYIDKLSHSASEDKLELFQELFFKKAAYNNPFQDKFYYFRGRTIKDILTSIAQEKKQCEWIFPAKQEKADDLYIKFVDVIAEGAAKYPVKLFLGEKWHSIQEQNDHGLIVFKKYCEKLKLKTHEDAIFVSEFWFELFYLEQHFFSSSISSSQRYFSDLKTEGPFFYKNVFCKFINDEDFICRFLSIRQDSSSAISLAVYCLACWVIYQFNKNESMSDVFNEASKKLLHEKKITFPDKIAESIRSYKYFDKLKRKENNSEAGRFLSYLSAALGGEMYQKILKKKYNAEDDISLYYIMYNYEHANFPYEEYFNLLINEKGQNYLGRENNFYNLELINEAFKAGLLKKQDFLEKVYEYMEENHELLIKNSERKKLINFFMETEEAKKAFFMNFCKRAVKEGEDSYEELYLFHKIYNDFYSIINTILETNTDINNSLVTGCCKMLNNFKKNIGQKEVSDYEYHFLNDYILPASKFVWKRTGDIWKALKPLIIAFRASKSILLDESLNINNKNILSYSLINGIIDFFYIKDQEKLKELRYNMANDFAEYLKPAKNKRQAEKYTEKEQGFVGFNLSYTEPNPYWRYAYVRALGDLGIKTDKRGHYFQKILENVLVNDPSEDVRKAAKKVMEELNSIRKGYSGNNHKKCLFEAFWWLKCAHILSFGVQPDKKALDQRTKEWR